MKQPIVMGVEVKSQLILKPLLNNIRIMKKVKYSVVLNVEINQNKDVNLCIIKYKRYHFFK